MSIRTFSVALASSVGLLVVAWSVTAGAQPSPIEASSDADAPDAAAAPPPGPVTPPGSVSPPAATSVPAPVSPAPTPPAPVAAPNSAAATGSTDSGKSTVSVTPLGYVEAYYAYNFNRPSNGITNYRGFDNRHNSFTLQNAALGANFEAGPVGGRLVLQVGAVPSTYYLSEPTLEGTGSVNASGPELWKYLQEAFITYKAPVGKGILFQLGLCASPVGFETFPVKDNWNWSRSNLFFGFPFYHTGFRVTYPWTDAVTTTVSVFNGWNTVVDNNEEKSIESNVTYKKDALMLQALYFGGVERSTGAPEGPYWRHHFDAIAQYDATTWISFAGQADYGWEPNRIGTAKWAAGAAYVRVRPIEHVYVALRGDHFHEDVATSGAVTSAPLFWGGVEWVSSGTATLEVQPHDQISIRLEYRHDITAAPLFFRSNVAGDGSAAAPYIANARTQDTLLLGATAWF